MSASETNADYILKLMPLTKQFIYSTFILLIR